MEFYELIHKRSSVRAFRPTPPSDEQLQRILEAANRAPSAGNLQAYQIYVVRRAEIRQRLAAAALGQDFIAQAPLVLVFCAHPDRSAWRYRARGKRLYAIQDATIACTFAMLAAVDIGLGCVWVGAFDDHSVRNVIGAPPEYHPVAILPLGIPAETPEISGRRPLENLVHEA
jgi:nitroreductase